jgi:osmotically-inducible protein OsmY
MDSHRKKLNGPASYMACALLAALATLSAMAAGCGTAEAARLRADDGSITAGVKAGLAGDSDINPLDIDVTTNQRVVTLRGRVKTQEAREKAERIARQTDGVRRVVNLVKVGDEQ